MRGLSEAVRIIGNARSVIIAGHINPDGDCIGSLLALGLGLKSLGKRVIMLRSGSVPRMYDRLPAAGALKTSTPQRADLAISVDCNSARMLGPAVFASFRRSARVLEIDHHEFREPFGTVSLIDTQAAAVGEIIYTLLKCLRVRCTADIAQNILTSIIVETNSFRLPSVRSSTFLVCAGMLKTGVNFYALSDMIYWSKTPQAAVLSGLCLSRARFLRGGSIVWSKVTRSDFKKAHGRDADVDAVADDLRSIKGVRVSVLLRERDSRMLRVSVRSKEHINVARLAQKFGGGGHGDVAGCLIRNTPQSVAGFLKEVQRLVD